MSNIENRYLPPDLVRQEITPLGRAQLLTDGFREAMDMPNKNVGELVASFVMRAEEVFVAINNPALNSVMKDIRSAKSPSALLSALERAEDILVLQEESRAA